MTATCPDTSHVFEGATVISPNEVRYLVDEVTRDGWVTFHRKGVNNAERHTKRIERVAARMRPEEPEDRTPRKRTTSQTALTL